MIYPIDSAILGAMSAESLVQRMDELLRLTLLERYGQDYAKIPYHLVSQVTGTKKVVSLPEEAKKYLAHITFAYLVQLELGDISSGISNTILYNGNYHEETSWQSPTFRLRNSALHQFQIISSRIAMEIFMDLLYCLDTGHRMEKKRSKLKAFRIWLCDPQNQFHYFAHVLLAAYRFDRGIRTPEVHGASRLPRRLLLLQRPSSEEMNECHKLTIALLGCWHPLLEILNGQKPSHMNIEKGDREWFNAYMNGTEEEVVSNLALMFSGIE